MDTKHPDSDIIDALGGTAVVARLCKVKDPSVSDWRKTGIPAARRMYLETIRPEAFSTPVATSAPAEASHA
ncbi:hypothetical protein ACOTET_22885 [Achromobacter xylosoxidans]